MTGYYINSHPRLTRAYCKFYTLNKPSSHRSSVEAKKQKQYLKEILSNSLALMESLETEQKQRRNESQHTSQTDKKDHRKEIQTEEKGFRKEIQTDEKEHRQEILADEKEHRKGIQTEKEHRKEIEKEEKEHRMEIQSELKDHRQEIEGEEKEYAEKKAHGESEKPTPEPTKQATNKPTNTTKENGRTTEKQNVQSHASTKPMEKNDTSQPMEKTNVTSQDQKQPIEKRDGISDDMAKEIEEAEAEIQRVCLHVRHACSTRKNAQVVSNLQQTYCSNAVPTACQHDVFALLVPSLLTSCQTLVDNLLQGY